MKDFWMIIELIISVLAFAAGMFFLMLAQYVGG